MLTSEPTTAMQTSTQAYQAQLELVRRHEDQIDGWYAPDWYQVNEQLAADLDKARAAMEVAWCEGLLGEAGC